MTTAALFYFGGIHPPAPSQGTPPPPHTHTRLLARVRLTSERACSYETSLLPRPVGPRGQLAGTCFQSGLPSGAMLQTYRMHLLEMWQRRHRAQPFAVVS
jgi:hypothetical protein